MICQAKWIRPSKDMGDICPSFFCSFEQHKSVKKAVLRITALGVYEAVLNGNRIDDFILAPGWTSYQTRLQYQEYDITPLLENQNQLVVTVGKGWYRSPMPGWGSSPEWKTLQQSPAGLIAEVELTNEDGSSKRIITDSSWTCAESNVRFSEIYDGETYDASFASLTSLPPITSVASASSWQQEGNMWRYEVLTPVDAVIIIKDRTYSVKKGSYLFFSPLEQ